MENEHGKLANLDEGFLRQSIDAVLGQQTNDSSYERLQKIKDIVKNDYEKNSQNHQEI